jgi:hypothetical protein
LGHLLILQGIDIKKIQRCKKTNTKEQIINKWASELDGSSQKKACNINMKKHETSLAIKEMQIKTALRVHQENQQQKCWWG